jgi:hypothetical protein
LLSLNSRLKRNKEEEERRMVFWERVLIWLLVRWADGGVHFAWVRRVETLNPEF